MIQGQPVPTELDAAAERAAKRRATKWAPPATPAEPTIAPAAPDLGAPTGGGSAAPAGPAPAEAAPAPSAPAAAPAVPPRVLDPSMVGVVFIHGIGAQRAGETLLAWSVPIIRAMTAWRRDRDLPTDPVVTSKVDLTGRTTPFIELEVPEDPDDPAQRPRQRWVLTEAWWASDVEAPGISDMLKWLIWRGEARRIGEGIITGINAADDTARRQAVGPSGVLDPTAPSAGSSVVRRVRDAFER